MSQTFTCCYHFQCPWLLWRHIFLPAAIFPFASRTFFSVIQVWWVDSFSFWTSEDVFILSVFRRCLGRQFRKVLPQQWEMRYFCWVLNSRLMGVFFPLSTLKILSSICSTPGVHTSSTRVSLPYAKSWKPAQGCELGPLWGLLHFFSCIRNQCILLLDDHVLKTLFSHIFFLL